MKTPRGKVKKKGPPQRAPRGRPGRVTRLPALFLLLPLGLDLVGANDAAAVGQVRREIERPGLLAQRSLLDQPPGLPEDQKVLVAVPVEVALDVQPLAPALDAAQGQRVGVDLVDIERVAAEDQDRDDAEVVVDPDDVANPPMFIITTLLCIC